MKSVLKNLNTAIDGKWKVIKTIWPYPDGYGVYRKSLLGEITLLVAGLSKEDAQDYADEMNSKI